MILRHTLEEIESLAQYAIDTDDPDAIEDFLASWEGWCSGGFDEDGQPIEDHEALDTLRRLAEELK